MTLVADSVRIPGTGELFVGPTTTAAPTDVATALAAGFVGLGYTATDGVTLGRTVNREGISAWQSLTPLKYIYTGLELAISAAMLQSENEVASLWWGSDFAETVPASGVYKSDLSVIPTSVERSIVLYFEDEEAHKHRIYVPRTEITATGDVQISRSATAFQMTFGALTPTSGSVLATWFTNDPAFAPA